MRNGKNITIVSHYHGLIFTFLTTLKFNKYLSSNVINFKINISNI